jgi:hypothetical protein
MTGRNSKKYKAFRDRGSNYLASYYDMDSKKE